MEQSHQRSGPEMTAVRRVEIVSRVVASSSLLLLVTLAVLAAISSEDSRGGRKSLLEAGDLIREANKESAELRLLTQTHSKAKAATKPARQEALATALEKSSDAAEASLKHKIETSKEKTHLEHIRAEEREKREENAEMASHCVFCKTTKKTKQEQAAEDLALQKFSSLAAQSKEDRVEKTEKKPLTAEDKAKIREAALKIASVMQEDNPAESPGVQREMARLHKSGTSWNALWGGGDSSSLHGNKLAQFQYLAGKPRVFSHEHFSGADQGEMHGAQAREGGSDPISFSKDPFGSNFHY